MPDRSAEVAEVADAITESESAEAADTAADAEGVPDVGSSAEVETETAIESDVEPEPDAVPDTEPETDTETDTETEPETEPETGPHTDVDADTESEPAVDDRPPPPPPGSEDPPPPSPDIVDPHGVAPVLAGLDPAAAARSEGCLLLVASILAPGEQIDRIALGVVDGYAGMAVLTQQRVVLVNDHRWQPYLVSVPITPRLMVQGWQDETAAQLTFEGGVTARIEQIVDKQQAFDMALRVRVRVSEVGGPSVP